MSCGGGPSKASRIKAVRVPRAFQIASLNASRRIASSLILVIIRSGTGQAFGVVDLVDVIGPSSMDDLVGSNQLPSSEREEFRKAGLPYRKPFAYLVKNRRILPFKTLTLLPLWSRMHSPTASFSRSSVSTSKECCKLMDRRFPCMICPISVRPFVVQS